MVTERFEWYYLGETGQLGPLSETQILELADHAVISRETMVWKVGMGDWIQAGSVPRLAERLVPAVKPPPISVPPPAPARTAPTSGVKCPRDGSPMRHEIRSGVEVDWCPQCKGVWLDRGELDKLIDREGDDDDYRDRDRGRRKKGFLGEVFDMFD